MPSNQKQTFQLIVSKYLVNILVFIAISFRAYGQNNLYVDTISFSHSKYGDQYGQELVFKYYYLSYQDLEDVLVSKTKEQILDKYVPLANFLVPESGYSEDMRTTSFSVLKVICKDTFSFNMPISNYKVRKSDLYEYGITLNDYKQEGYEAFGELKPKVINFYKDFQAVNSILYEEQEIQGAELEKVYREVAYDMITIILRNDKDDILEMTFFLID